LEGTLLNGKKIVVVMPAYNAEKTLHQTFGEVPSNIVDEIILVDDGSLDSTVQVAQEIGITTFLHNKNMGYGRNQKTCYSEALKRNGDIIIMLHPDYQYTPNLLVSMAGMIAYGEYDTILASRIIGGGALKGGMPLYKYIANRFLTAFQNIFIGQKLSEYHTGYRAFARNVIESLPLEENSDDFVFDNEMITQIAYFNYRIGELSCPTKYFPEASSINFKRSVKYGLGVLNTSIKFRLQKWGLKKFRIFSLESKGLPTNYYKQIESDKNYLFNDVDSKKL
jgi:glycosyltransferase involved in cell wall biosynthesis